MSLSTGCDHTGTRIVKSNFNSLLIKAVPRFPEPSPKIADELDRICPKGKCEALFDWIGRLKVLQEQLELFEKYDDQQ